MPTPPRLLRGFLPIAIAAVLAAPALAASGGPDAYGYTWRDSFEPGVVYAWEDVTMGGTDVTVMADDGNTGFLPLSFQFPYYGIRYTRVAMSTNGWFSFVDGSSSEWQDVPLPTAGAPVGALAVYWEDLSLRNNGRMYVRDFGDRAVLHWERVPIRGTFIRVTVQAILHADGRIVFQYADVPGGRAEATVGIESADETTGLTVHDNAPFPAAPYAIEFQPPPPLPNMLDCTMAGGLGCGDVVLGDLAAGVSRQDEYRCSRDVLDGREQMYLVAVPTPTTMRFVFEAITGSPRMLVLPACDPNACSLPPGGILSFVDGSGVFLLVVDAPAGQEGTYRLRVECLPLATTMDCDAVMPLGCGELVSGDLSLGQAGQDSYWCSVADYSGREQVWQVDLPIRLPSVTFSLTALSGAPDLIVLDPCDANACLAPPGDEVTLMDAVGTYYVVVDAPFGQEGAYDLAITGGGVPGREVGNALRATGHGVSTVDFDWSLAGLPLPGDSFAVLRSDDDPVSGFEILATTRMTAWQDPDAPPRFAPTHVWYYLVLISDPCGNLSSD